MRKADYSILARELRARVTQWPPADAMGHGLSQDEYLKRQSVHLQAVSMARYCADHLSVDRVSFLKACGLRQ